MSDCCADEIAKAFEWRFGITQANRARVLQREGGEDAISARAREMRAYVAQSEPRLGENACHVCVHVVIDIDAVLLSCSGWSGGRGVGRFEAFSALLRNGAWSDPRWSNWSAY